MAITNGYTDLTTVKSRLDIAKTLQDAAIERMVEAASRQIDGWCARAFYTETVARAVTAEWPGEIALDRDLLSITALATDQDRDGVFEVTWSVSDYRLVGNAPFQSIAARNGAFPVESYAVQVTGEWGYAATVPAPIAEATLLLVARLLKRKDAPFGIAGTQDMGQLQTIGRDKDVEALIAPYRRFGAVGGY